MPPTEEEILIFNLHNWNNKTELLARDFSASNSLDEEVFSKE
jgi:hypothetical protein